MDPADKDSKTIFLYNSEVFGVQINLQGMIYPLFNMYIYIHMSLS